MTLVGNAFTGVLERKRADDGLRASEARYRELADVLPVGIYEADLDGVVGIIVDDGDDAALDGDLAHLGKSPLDPGEALEA